MEPFQNQKVAKVFNAYPKELNSKLLALRQLIFDTASKIDQVGQIEETLRWGQPSYLTTQTKSGTTIRIDQIKSKPGQYGMFVHCQTSLLSTYRELFPDALDYDGKRCIRFKVMEDPPEQVLRNCIALAPTYHLNSSRERLPF